MTRFNVVIDDLVEGDDLDLKRTVHDVPSSQTLTKAYLTIKEDPDDDDVDAIVQKTITSSLVVGQGQITDTGADGTGEIIFELTATDSGVTLVLGQVYHYDIQLHTSAGKIFTFESGTISTRRGITDATS